MNWAYIAGFFDGEGSLSKNKSSGWRWQVSQNDKAVLIEIQDFLRSYNIPAYITCWKITTGGNKAYVLRVDTRMNIYKIVTMIKDFTIVKQPNIARFLAWLKVSREFPIISCPAITRMCLSFKNTGLGRLRIARMIGDTEGRVRQAIMDAGKGKLLSCKNIHWDTSYNA